MSAPASTRRRLADSDAPPCPQAALRQALCYVVAFATFAVLALVVAPRVDFTPYPPSTPPHPPVSKQTSALGFICAALNVAMYAAPLSIMGQVVRTRSVEFMPLSLTVATGVCSTCWLIYGIKAMDWFILTPNVAGVALTVVQLALYAAYCGGKGSKGAHLISDDVEADEGVTAGGAGEAGGLSGDRGDPPSVSSTTVSPELQPVLMPIKAPASTPGST